jgi:hypothetical protein
MEKRMADTLDPRLLDKRTAARYLRNGQLEEKSYERHLRSLPDLADRAATVEADLTAVSDDDDEEVDDEEGSGEPAPSP